MERPHPKAARTAAPAFTVRLVRAEDQLDVTLELF